MRNYKLLLLLLFKVISTVYTFGQEDLNQKEFINAKIEIANKILYNFNQNIENLNVFQEELKIWISKKNNESSFPKLKFNTKEEIDIYYCTRKDHGLLMKNYEFQLFKLDKYSDELNELCIELKNLSFNNSLQYNVEVAYYLRKIEKKARFIAEITNDLSWTSLLNYKDDAYPPALYNLKEIVLNSKNLILAMRHNNTDYIIGYKKLLDETLVEAKMNSSVSNLKESSLINLDDEIIQSSINNIYSKAENISSWANQHLSLKGSYEANEDELNHLLQLAITDFNKTEELFGCAFSFNKILKNTPKKHLIFTEEPSAFLVERIKIPKKKKVVEDAKIKQNPVPENLNSLDGSMPTNVILLMDVSISMKKSGKFPLLIESIKHTANIMRPIDKLSLIAYSGKAQVLISAATNKDQAKINEILNSLQSSGGSDLENALKEAYKIAEDNFISNGNNKLIIASDGIFGVTPTISNLANKKVDKGFSLSVFHYGSKKDGANTKTLKTLAETGNGQYELIETEEEAINALMRQIKKKKEAVERFY